MRILARLLVWLFGWPVVLGRRAVGYCVRPRTLMFGACLAVGMTASAFATTWTGIYQGFDYSDYTYVWIEDGVTKACSRVSNSGGVTWVCCNNFNWGDYECNGSWGVPGQPHLLAAIEAFGPVSEPVQWLVDDLYGGSIQELWEAAGIPGIGGGCPWSVAGGSIQFDDGSCSCTYTPAPVGAPWCEWQGDCTGCADHVLDAPIYLSCGCSEAVFASLVAARNAVSPCRDFTVVPATGCDSGGGCMGTCNWSSYSPSGGGLAWDLTASDCTGSPCGCPCPTSAPTTFPQSTGTVCTAGGTGGPCGTGPPPGECDENGGDGDNDGCCADVDVNDSDPAVCTPSGECDDNGGDGDNDGCCADVDVNDSDPTVCNPPADCDLYGGDADGDGCCASPSTPGGGDCDDSDPERCSSCPMDCDDWGGDADDDGCCASPSTPGGGDCDDSDPEQCHNCVCKGKCKWEWRKRACTGSTVYRWVVLSGSEGFWQYKSGKCGEGCESPKPEEPGSTDGQEHTVECEAVDVGEGQWVIKERNCRPPSKPCSCSKHPEEKGTEEGEVKETNCSDHCMTEGDDFDGDGCCHEKDVADDDPEAGCEKCHCKKNPFERWERLSELFGRIPVVALFRAIRGNVRDAAAYDGKFVFPLPSVCNGCPEEWQLDLLPDPVSLGDQGKRDFQTLLRAVLLTLSVVYFARLFLRIVSV